MMNVRNLWKSTVLLLGLSSMLPTVVGCDAAEDAVATSSVSHEKLRLQVNFRPLMQGNGNSINKDAADKEDEVVNVTIRGIGEAFSVDNTGAKGVATWEYQGINPSTFGDWSFVTNVHADDKARLKVRGANSDEVMETSKYLRGYNGLSAKLPLVMVARMDGAFEDKGNNVRVFNRGVTLWRAFSRFIFQTYPLPEGYVIKKVTVERIPGKFMLDGATSEPYSKLNRNAASTYPYIGGLVIWDRSLPQNKQPFASWQKSKWVVSYDPHPDMYLSGQFYMPPCKVDTSVDPFGKSTDGGMPFMRFVFTDNQGHTFVRLYRLGSSSTGGDRGQIGSDKKFDIRINLLGSSVVRDESLRTYDDGSNKAAFVN